MKKIMIFMVLATFMLASCGTQRECPNKQRGNWININVLNK